MTILYYVQTESDYGPDTIYDGLCRVLGSRNVLEYPEKPNYHSQKVGRGLYYPCLFDYPIFKTDAEKLAMLKNNEFDCLIVPCRIKTDREDRYAGPFYELLKEKSQTIPTFLLDQGDLPGIRTDLQKDLHCRGYFKREYFGEKDIVPLNLSYSEKYLPQDIATKRTIPLFWAGSFNSYRKAYLNGCGIVDRTRYSQEEYRDRLLKTKIGLNLRGFGFDCVRYYEIPAHGALLFSEKLPITIVNDFTDGENAVFFSSLAEQKEKLDYLLTHDDYVDKIRLKGYKHYIKYHTGTARAKQLLNYLSGH